MESSQVIALVAIAISLVGLGLAFVFPVSLESDIAKMRDELIGQSQEITTLNSQLNDSTQLIKTQNSIINDINIQQNASQTQINNLQTNAVNLENQISSLETRISTLEQKLNPQSPSPAPETMYFPNAVGFYNAADGGGVDDNRVFKQLPSTLPADAWTVDFDYKFIASSIPVAYPLALTTSSTNPDEQGTGSAVLVYHGENGDVLHIRTCNGPACVDFPGQYTGIPISPNTQYYVRLERTPTQLQLSAFSDPARTIDVPGSPVTEDITPDDFKNLSFIQHSTSLLGGPARTLTAELTNTKIYSKLSDGSEKILFQDDYHSSNGWTQVGTSIIVNGHASTQITSYPIPSSLP